MKILAFSDLHQEELALDSLIGIHKNYDFVFGCGDVCDSISFLEDLTKNIKNLFLIPGNYESKRVAEYLLSLDCSIHGKRKELIDGYNVVGFGFSTPTPFFTYGELTEDEITTETHNLAIDSKSILLLHCPPYGYFDKIKEKNVGSKSLLNLINNKNPFLALFGHIHETRGQSKLLKTTLLKLPPANEFLAIEILIKNNLISEKLITL